MTSRKKEDAKRGSQREREGFPESTIPLFFEQMQRQMDLWNEFVESEEGKEATQAGMDFAQISTKHTADMFAKIGDVLPKNMSAEEVFQKSREIYMICANSYSEMFKEAMATPSIPRQNWNLVNAFLDWKIETDRINQETLESLGVPTRNDMDEIAEKLYWLDKKMDNIAKELRQNNPKSPRSKRK